MVFMTGGTLVPQSADFLATLKYPLLEKPFDIGQLRGILRAMVAASLTRAPRG
jgi:hypothetical protein